jgi:hypothetical protein
MSGSHPIDRTGVQTAQEEEPGTREYRKQIGEHSSHPL